MRMQKAYQRIDWENYPSENTPLNETNLNKMDVALNEIDNRLINHDTTKLNVTVANDMVKEVSFDEATGIFTITKLNGSAVAINTNLEKLAVNFVYDRTNQQLVITLDDGTKQYVDMSAILTQYEFVESDTIYFEITTDGNVKASIKNGSITPEMLRPDYLADIKVQAEIATQKATEAATQSSKATTEADRASTEADRAAQYADIVAPGFYVDIDTMTLYIKDGVGVDFVIADDNTLCWKIA